MNAKKPSQKISELSPALEPKRDLWPGIEAAISQPEENVRRSSSSPALRIAAVAAMAAVVIGAAVTAAIRLSPAGKHPKTENLRLELLVTEVSDAYKTYEKARSRLLKGIEKLEKRYGYDLSAPLKADFASIDEQIRAAVADAQTHPDDVHAAGSALSLINSQLVAISFTENLVRETRDEEQLR